MISVVVPIYNEEEIISRLHGAVAGVLHNADEDWELVYVNDGSRDSSLDLLRKLQIADSHVVVVDLSRNWGHMGAISAGLRTARGDAVILMDADLQDPPEVLPQMLGEWRGGAQVVVGVRRSRQERRKILAKLFPLFYRVLAMLSDYPIPLDAGIFGLMDRQVVDSINAMREGNRYLPGLRAWVGYKSATVFYDRQDRAAGEGKLSFLSRVKYAMDAISSFSYKPLRLSFALFCFSESVVAILAVSSILAENPVDSVGLAVTAAVFQVGGMLLLCLGFMGEYLARVYDEVRGRPLSIINNVYGASEMIAAPTASEFKMAEPGLAHQETEFTLPFKRRA